MTYNGCNIIPSNILSLTHRACGLVANTIVFFLSAPEYSSAPTACSPIISYPIGCCRRAVEYEFDSRPAALALFPPAGKQWPNQGSAIQRMLESPMTNDRTPSPHRPVPLLMLWTLQHQHRSEIIASCISTSGFRYHMCSGEPPSHRTKQQMTRQVS